MSIRRQVLIVSPDSLFVSSLPPAVQQRGYALTIARTFEAAKAQLTSATSLVVTELKLAAYNGLHVALRARAAGIPAIVVASRAFEGEAEQLGAVWLSPESAASGELDRTIRRVLQGLTSMNDVIWEAISTGPPRLLADPSYLLH